MTLRELYEASRVPLILYDGTKIRNEFIKTYGSAKVDMFCIDWRSESIVVFPEGCYTPADVKRCGL